jgi:4-amino-4-deoxy-L-arabinose transferase-like glycosyltransferase
VSEFAARFGSALFGLGTILSLWLLGKSVQSSKFKVQCEETKDEGQRTKDNFANWLALIAASSIGLLSFSRGASFDIILTFPITAALVAYFLFDQREQKSGFTFYFLLFTFYFFVGVAILAKGLVGFVLPFAIISFYHVLRIELVPSAKFCFSLVWGIPLILLVAATWYLPMYQINGWKFIDEFIIQHHFQRYTSNKYQHPQPFWFFWIVLPLMTVPWIPFFLASIWNFFKVQSSKFKVQSKKKVSPLLIFAFAWMLVPLVFFSLSGSKLPGYILPALPAALILTADYVYKFVQKSKLRVVALQTLAFLMFAVVAVLLQFVVPNFAYADSVKGLMETADAQGFTNERVLNLHTISHNSEFYFSGRLIRAEDGKLRKFLGIAEINEQLKNENGKNLLVLVPLEFLHELTESDDLETRVLSDNGKLAIVVIYAK